MLIFHQRESVLLFGKRVEGSLMEQIIEFKLLFKLAVALFVKDSKGYFRIL